MRSQSGTDAPLGRNRGRLVAGLAIASLSAVALTGCGDAGNAASGKTTIRYMYATGDDTWNAATEAIVDAFNEQSDETVVALDPLPAGSDYATAIKTMDATGNWPALVDMRDTLTYIEAGKLAPIPEEVTGLLEEEVYQASDDGNVYTIPTGALNGDIGQNIVYDVDYFDEHGLSVPDTYGDFIQLMDDIKANGDVPLAIAAAEVWPSNQLWKPLAAPTFAKYSDEGGYWTALAEGAASIDDLRDPLERAKEITDSYVLEGWQSTTDAQTTTLLVNRQAVMATSSAGIGRLNDINNVDPEFNAGLFIIPDDNGDINVLKSSVNGDTASGLAISSQAAENDAEYNSAVEFLEFYYSVEGANLLEKTGWIAPNIKKSDEITRNTSIPGASDYFALLEHPKLKWFVNDSSLNMTSFNTYANQSRIAMLDGQMSIDELLDTMEAEFEKVVAQQ